MSANNFASIEEIIEEARAGRMFILVDDEDRENEGDLIIPADKATPDVINFMAKFGRGLICLALTSKRIDELRLPLMAQGNSSRFKTAFTLSIEAKEGVTTGISAADRSHTIMTAINPEKSAEDVVSPGHIFPLRAQDGGVLVRSGHTEAAVDIARLSGLNPSGVICEIMNEDGTMARRPELVDFAQKHGLKIASIAELIAYRLRKEKLIEKVREEKMTSEFGGEFKVISYRDVVGNGEHLALVKGDILDDKPVMVRVHHPDFSRDLLGFTADGKSSIRDAMQIIAKAGRGVVVLPADCGSLSPCSMFAIENNEKNQPHELRNYGLGAQILRDLGVKDMILLTNSSKVVIGIEGFGLNIIKRQSFKAGEL